MMNVTYGVTEELYSLGHASRTSFGIAVYADAEEDGTTTIVASVHDISSDKQALVELVSRCNRLELSSVHLMDTIEEFLVN